MVSEMAVSVNINLSYRSGFPSGTHSRIASSFSPIAFRRDFRCNRNIFQDCQQTLRASVDLGHNVCDARCVNKTILVFGDVRLIRRAASIPPITGICQSKMTRSGASWLTFSTAIWPFSASPHTFHASFCSIRRRRHRRKALLSSTIRIE